MTLFQFPSTVTAADLGDVDGVADVGAVVAR